MIQRNGRELDIDIGNRHFVIQRRYEAVGARLTRAPTCSKAMCSK